MAKLSDAIVKFSGGNTALYEAFLDYWNHYRNLNGGKNLEFDGTVSFSEKEERLNAALRKEIFRVAGVQSVEQFPIETYVSNPQISWATFAVVSALVDMVLPDSIIQSIGLYTDVKTIGWGDSAAFDVKPRDIFTVSKAGRAMRTAEMRKQFNGQVVILPEMRQISVQVSLARVLAGKESLADFVAKATRSMETQIAYDVYYTFNATAAALDNAGTDALRYSGFDSSTFVSLAQRLSAWNGGATTVAVGTQLALQNILPTHDVNYRYDLTSDYVKIGYLRNFLGVDLMVLPQVADWRTEFSVLLDDTHLYLMTPSTNKIVKLIMEGNMLSNVSTQYQNASLIQDATLYRSWGVGVATNSLMGLIELS